MQRMQAIKEFRYAQETRRPGDEPFEVEDRHAPALAKLGCARKVGAEVAAEPARRGPGRPRKGE